MFSRFKVEIATDISQPRTAAYSEPFYLHHSYVDYQWAFWQERQRLQGKAEPISILLFVCFCSGPATYDNQLLTTVDLIKRTRLSRLSRRGLVWLQEHSFFINTTSFFLKEMPLQNSLTEQIPLQCLGQASCSWSQEWVRQFKAPKNTFLNFS